MSTSTASATWPEMARATPTIVRELRRVLDEASIPDVVGGVYLADEAEAR
jgi:hypothetical protein